MVRLPLNSSSRPPSNPVADASARRGFTDLCRRPPRWLWCWWLVTLAAAGLAAWALLDMGWSERSYERVQERLEEGRPPATHHAARVYTWRAGWINVAGLLLLAAAGPWLGRPLASRRQRIAPGVGEPDANNEPVAEAGVGGRPEDTLPAMGAVPDPVAGRQARWVLVLMILAITAVSGFLNAPRLTLSLWGDEEFTAKRFITGLPTLQEDGSWQVEAPPWRNTLWDLGRMNNHFLFSVLGRLSHETFGPDPAAATGPRDPWFSETIVRLPAFIAGLLALPATAWCLRLWGIGRVATAAAVLLLALHPWYVRHAVDARGYALVLLWVPLLVASIRLALNHPGWGRWLLVGLLTFLMFYSYLGTVYLLAAIHGALLLYWLLRWGRERVLPIGAGRWATGLALSAMLGLQLVSPCLPAIGLVTENPQFHGKLDAAWWLDTAGFVASGTPWLQQVPDHPVPAAVESLWQRQPVVTAGALGVLGLVTLGGLLALLVKSGRREGWLVAAWVLGAPVVMGAHTWISDLKPYHWYLMLFLPGLVFAIGAGLDGLWRWRVPSPVKRVVTVLTLLAMIWLGHDKSRQLRHYPFEACRDSVEQAREVTNPLHPDYDRREMTAGFVMYTELYDPGAHRITTGRELRELMAEADESGRALHVHYGSPGLARLVASDIMNLLENPELFELVAVLPGHKAFTTREVRRYRQGRIERAPAPVLAGGAQH